MKIVKLGTHTSGLLFVQASVIRMVHGAPKKCRPIDFVVDTASERSFICKYHQTILEDKLGARSGIKIVITRTLVGDMKYSSSTGYSLQFACVGQNENVTVNYGPDSELCFADDTLKANLPGDPNHAKTKGYVNPINYFSILGRDLLRQFHLFIPNGMSKGGVLVKDDTINHSENWIEMCNALDNPTRPLPITETISQDINWADARYHRPQK